MTKTEKVETFCKVWGFLKYYHPAVTSGKYNWDEVFLSRYKEVVNINTTTAYNTYINQWILSLANGQSYAASDNVNDQTHNNTALAFVSNNRILNDTVKWKLISIIEKKKSSKGSFYAQKHKIGYALFTNEQPYLNMDFNVEELRMLALSRYWNIINYFYPYKQYTDIPWDHVLTMEISEFEQANDSIKYYSALNSLLSKVNDSHCRLLNNPHYSEVHSSRKKLPVEFKIIYGKIYIALLENISYTKPYYEIGDEVLSIDGISTDTLLKRYSNKISASNIKSYYRDVAQRLSWSKDSIIQLKIKRGEKYIDISGVTYPPVELDRDLEEVNKLLPHHLLPDNIGYVSLASVNRYKIKSVLRLYRKCKGIILDVREYPEFSMYELCSKLSVRKRKFSTFIKPDFSHPGLFTNTTFKYCGHRHWFSHYHGRVAVLVDEHTQSRGEFTTMSLKTLPNSKIIGRQTAGTDGDVSKFILPGGYETVITALGISYPNGTRTQRDGIAPDILIEDNSMILNKNNDRFIEAAVRYIMLIP